LYIEESTELKEGKASDRNLKVFRKQFIFESKGMGIGRGRRIEGLGHAFGDSEN
jgi:hypothetical protein